LNGEEGEEERPIKILLFWGEGRRGEIGHVGCKTSSKGAKGGGTGKMCTSKEKSGKLASWKIVFEYRTLS